MSQCLVGTCLVAALADTNGGRIGRCLTSKRNAAVSAALLDIFSLLGPPAILQTDNGREFQSQAGVGRRGNGNKDSHGVPLGDDDMEEIIEHIERCWPGVKLVHGRARHSESQGGIERLNRYWHVPIAVLAGANSGIGRSQ